MKTQGYRKELDGLRALAVSAVIFYHAGLDVSGPGWLPGGFLGVDVFFVLSGYLITGILVRRKDLTLLQFYKGRVDRIYPALVLLTVLISFVSYFLLEPAALVEYANSLLGALGFYSNYIFMFEDGYVSHASKYKVLLHTWSLGVEWQYYMLFPLLILGLRRCFTNRIPIVLALLALLSFVYCLALLAVDQVGAFYSTAARVWQLFVGGLVFFVAQKTVKCRLDTLLSLVGMVLILFSFMYFNDADPHPGFVSLTAVLGAGLFILFVRPDSWLYQVFSLPLLVWLGGLSYSLYLYHQPVLVFYRVAFAETSSLSLLWLLPVMLLLAYVSYRFFEEPMRRSSRHSKYVLLLFLLLPVLMYALMARSNQGFIQRQPEAVRQALVHFQGPEWTRLQGDVPGMGFDGKPLKTCSARTAETACRFGSGKPDLVVVGDSFAGVFTYALHERLNSGLLVMHHGECPLLADPIWFGGQPGCWEVNKSRWQVLEHLEPTAVLIAASYLQFYKAKKSVEVYRLSENNLTHPLPPDEVFESFRRAVTRLVQLGHRPLVVLQPPRPKQDIEAEMKRRVSRGELGFRKQYGAESSHVVDQQVIETLQGIAGVRLLSINQKLCDDRQRCQTFNEQGGLFNRGPHLSYLGAQYFIDEILNHIAAGDDGE